jgi:hypothetical protein
LNGVVAYLLGEVNDTVAIDVFGIDGQPDAHIAQFGGANIDQLIVCAPAVQELHQR